MEVASLEATEEIMAVASFPQAPYVSTTIGTHTHPRSEHLGSLAWCFLDSVAVVDSPVLLVYAVDCAFIIHIIQDTRIHYY